MRNSLYMVKEWCKRLFIYPQTFVLTQDHTNYDAYWKNKRGSNIGKLSEWQKERADYIATVLAHDVEARTIADIGCGDGSILDYLKQKIPQVSTCIGYDNSPFALARAEELGVETLQIDISNRTTYELLREADYYLLLETLEHVQNSEELFLKAFSKSKRGLIFSFPNTGYLQHRLRLLFGRFPLQWRMSPNEHVRFWTLADLRWWLGRLSISDYTIHCYQGIPILNRILPSVFSAGFIVSIKKKTDTK